MSLQLQTWFQVSNEGIINTSKIVSILQMEEETGTDSSATRKANNADPIAGSDNEIQLKNNSHSQKMSDLYK